MSDEIRICRVEVASADVLGGVADGVFGDSIDPARLRSYLAYPASMLVVAVDGDLVVGQVKAAVSLHPDKAADLYIDEVAVAATHRRRGIARGMIEEVARWAKERGCADVWLAANPDNASARSLYGRFAESKPAVLYYWDL